MYSLVLPYSNFPAMKTMVCNLNGQQGTLGMARSVSLENKLHSHFIAWTRATREIIFKMSASKWEKGISGI